MLGLSRNLRRRRYAEGPMCGRVDIHTPPSELARLLETAMALGVDPEGRPSWNVPPSRGVPVIVEEKTTEAEPEPKEAEQGLKMSVPKGELERRLDIYRWGLLPHWAKSPSTGYKMINAKCETLNSSSAYRVPFRKSRCLVVVDGFYEWQADPTQPKKKAPYYFRRADGKPITFAGLYEVWWDKTRSKEPDPETLLRTCTIITTEAGPDMVEVHNRMPVIIERDQMDAWLDPDQHDPDALKEFLAPAPGGTLLKYLISKSVNSPRNDGPQIIEPLSEPED
jgi:putative SOS response-associated peptidase YedK